MPLRKLQESHQESGHYHRCRRLDCCWLCRRWHRSARAVVHAPLAEPVCLLTPAFPFALTCYYCYHRASTFPSMNWPVAHYQLLNCSSHYRPPMPGVVRRGGLRDELCQPMPPHSSGFTLLYIRSQIRLVGNRVRVRMNGWFSFPSGKSQLGSSLTTCRIVATTSYARVSSFALSS